MVPMIFDIDRRDATGYGLKIQKRLGNDYCHLQINDPYELRQIRIDFVQLLGMVNEIDEAEQKEMTKRIDLGV